MVVGAASINVIPILTVAIVAILVGADACGWAELWHYIKNMFG